ncbi:hypothetical protein EWB00_005452 [Schistosoma japonicum]|uniref:Trematode PH-like domain-containing protein n=1 Tax=Schistosoma japonicum TaxID=6182 RepID=A0A4Z2DUH7_SCHJA|nr:hypothetical protein EWB00_005452 [Schistosoma japonicum]
MPKDKNKDKLEIIQSTDYTESIYHVCYALLIHDLHLKSKSQLFERTEAENEVAKIKPIFPVRLYLIFCKDCIRIKRFLPHTNRYNRYTLFYKQIKVYYFTPYMKHLLILGIISPNGKKCSYQYIYIEDYEDLFKVQTILNHIFENPLITITEMPIIGQLIISSFKNESKRSKRLGRIIFNTSSKSVDEIIEMNKPRNIDTVIDKRINGMN